MKNQFEDSADSNFDDQDQSSDSAEYNQNNQEQDQQIVGINNEFWEQLSPRREIADKKYSLEPDMIFGWVPKTKYVGPIALQFENRFVDTILRQLRIQMNSSIYEIVYIGDRPHNSLKVHEKYSQQQENSYTFKYDYFFKEQESSHLQQFFDIYYSQNPSKNEQETYKKYYKDGVNPKTKDNPLVLEFDSNFESGNLDAAIKITYQEYDLFMRSDSNTRGHTHWFNFKVKKMEKGKTYKFNICNFSKKKCLYLRGMRPYTNSQQESELFQYEKWTQQGQNVSYEKQQTRYTHAEGLKQYFTLSFEYTCKYDNDIVQFAYCVPYTFSKLEKFIHKKSQELKSEKIDILQTEKLCSSLSGLDIPLLTITDFQTENILPLNNRSLIVINARIHPGESNGSWVMHGILDNLLNKENYDKNKSLLQRVVFKIIPMLNPDGVIMGNYRTGFAGRDLNRQYLSSNKLLYPSVIALKDFIFEQKKQFKNIEMFIDLHGHSVKKNIFSYSPEFSLWDINYYKSRLLPKLLSDNSDMFRYHSSIFRISQGKKSTARAVLHNQFGINNCYTFESSNGSYYQEDVQGNRTLDFDNKKWQEMGKIIVEQLEQYIHLKDQISENMIQKVKLNQENIENLQKNNLQNKLSKYSDFQSENSEDDKIQPKKLNKNNTALLQRDDTSQDENTLKINSNNFQSDCEDKPISSHRKNLKNKMKKITKNSDNQQQSFNFIPQEIIYEKVNKKQKKGSFHMSSSNPTSSTTSRKYKSNNNNKKSKKFLEDKISSVNYNSNFNGIPTIKSNSNTNKNHKNLKVNKKEQELQILKQTPFRSIFGDLEKNTADRDSDKFSEGGSDSESSDEDFDKNYLKQLEKNVQSTKNMLNNINTLDKLKLQKPNKEKKKISTKRLYKNNNPSQKTLTKPKSNNQSQSQDPQQQKINNQNQEKKPPQKCITCQKIILNNKENLLQNSDYCKCEKKPRIPLYKRQIITDRPKHKQTQSNANLQVLQQQQQQQTNVINLSNMLCQIPKSQQNHARPQSANMVRYLHQKKQQLLKEDQQLQQQQQQKQQQQDKQQQQQQQQQQNFLQKGRHWQHMQQNNTLNIAQDQPYLKQKFQNNNYTSSNTPVYNNSKRDLTLTHNQIPQQNQHKKNNLTILNKNLNKQQNEFKEDNNNNQNKFYNLKILQDNEDHMNSQNNANNSQFQKYSNYLQDMNNNPVKNNHNLSSNRQNLVKTPQPIPQQKQFQQQRQIVYSTKNSQSQLKNYNSLLHPSQQYPTNQPQPQQQYQSSQIQQQNQQYQHSGQHSSLNFEKKKTSKMGGAFYNIKKHINLKKRESVSEVRDQMDNHHHLN